MATKKTSAPKRPAAAIARTRAAGAAKAKAKPKAAKASGTKAKAAKPLAQVQGGDGPARPSSTFPIVALGASAGGLGALQEFFTSMPAPCGMAFVVITHQHAAGPSLLPGLLARKTEMAVVEVGAETPVEPDHVYLARPGFNLAILNGVLQPLPTGGSAPTMPVDFFFRSLAQDQKERAVGIVLSGTGSDGSLGLKEIKAELGMVLAQDEKSAQYAGMPNSAAATELVDFVLPVDKMAARLLAYAATLIPGTRSAALELETATETLHQIFVLIRSRTGHDFSQYKVSTMRRRIERRMNVHHIDSEKKYVRYLQANPSEVDLLFRELLIGVTAFFRDPEAWEALATHLSRLTASKPEGYVFRAWLAGCSTGEEAYSLAILLREVIDANEHAVTAQIFATDLDAGAIDVARAGVYPAGIVNDVPQKRLTRYFIEGEDSFTVKQEIREMVVFAPQNLISDPPFTKLDLLSCRNLLIYLEADLQQRLVPIFHYSLKSDGLLFLGSSESINAFGALFSARDKKWKIFQRRDVPPGTYSAEFPAVRLAEGAQHTLTAAAGPRGPADFGLGLLAERVLLRELVPPTILVHERGEVVHIHGRTGLFLEPAPGAQSAPNLFNMAREGLQVSLSAAMRQATIEDKEVIYRGIEIKANGEPISIDLKVRRLREPESLRGLLRVSFLNASAVPGEAGAIEVQKPDRTEELERELQYTRETQQSILEQLETANEELKSTNEEMQSTNEELQSTNEELETSKEEMQSLNEELQTLNAELQDKVEELSRANNDMKNLLDGTNIATIFLDNDLNIKRFTEQAKRVIRLIPSDVGRPIGDLVSTLHYDHLVEDAREVLRALSYRETEVRGENEAWYLMRILPYRTVENVIDGLVLTFVDITVVRALQHGQRLLLEGLKNSPTRVFGHDRELRYTWASGDVFGREPAELEGKTDAELFGAQASKEIVELKKRVRNNQTTLRQRVTLKVAGVPRTYQLYAEPAHDATGDMVGILCVATDLTPAEESASARAGAGGEPTQAGQDGDGA